MSVKTSNQRPQRKAAAEQVDYENLRVRNLQLVGNDGQKYAHLGFDQWGDPSLYFLTRDGEVALSVGISGSDADPTQYPSIDLNIPRVGLPSAGIKIELDNDGPSIVVAGSKKERVTLTAAGDLAMMQLQDSEGNIRVSCDSGRPGPYGSRAGVAVDSELRNDDGGGMPRYAVLGAGPEGSYLSLGKGGDKASDERRLTFESISVARPVSTTADLEKRVAELERQLQEMRNEVRTGHLVVVNANGDTVAELEHDEETKGSNLYLYDENGDQRVWAFSGYPNGHKDEGAFLILTGAGGEAQEARDTITLDSTATDDGGPEISMRRNPLPDGRVRRKSTLKAMQVSTIDVPTLQRLLGAAEVTR